MALDAARSTAERRTGRASQTSLAPRTSDEGVARGSPPSVARAVCSELVPKPPGNVRASLSGCLQNLSSRRWKFGIFSGYDMMYFGIHNGSFSPKMI